MSESTFSNLDWSGRIGTRRLWRGFLLVALFGLGTLQVAQAYDRVIPTPWNIGANLTPSNCLSGNPWTAPDSDGSPERPESAREEVLGFANARCHDGLGACNELTRWVGFGQCRSEGNGLQYGSVYCSIRAEGTYSGPMDNGGKCTGAAAPWHQDRLLSLTKFCQATTSDGMFDEASRQCVCREGEFVPEVGRCIKPRDRFWNADCDTCFGNPIYPLLGAKRQSIEFGGFAGLALSATYDSIRKVPQSDPSELGFIRPAPTSFGVGWESSLHKSFLFGSTTTNSSTVLINAARGSGRWVTFQNANDGRGGFAPASAGISDRLITLRTAGGGWQYLDASARAMESYDGTGRLMSISPVGGGRLTLSYSDAATPANVAPQPGLLIRIGNQFGRTLQLEYERPASATLAPRVKAMVDPAGLRTSFAYDAAGNLLQVNWPDGHARQLLYEHASLPWALTGYLDENLARAGTYSYDNTGRATGTERGAGADATASLGAKRRLGAWWKLGTAATM